MKTIVSLSDIYEFIVGITCDHTRWKKIMEIYWF